MEPAVETHPQYTAKRPVPVLPPLYRDGSGGSGNFSPHSSGTDSSSGTPQGYPSQPGYPLAPPSQRGTPTMRPAGARSPHLPPLPPGQGAPGAPPVYPRFASERPPQEEVQQHPAAYPRFASEKPGHYPGEDYGKPMNATYPPSTSVAGGGLGAPSRSPQAYPRMTSGLGSINEHGGGPSEHFEEYREYPEYQDYQDIQERPAGGGGGGGGRGAGVRQGQGAPYPRFASENPSQQYGDEDGAVAYPRFTSVSDLPPNSQGGAKRGARKRPSASGPLPGPALGVPGAGQNSSGPSVPYDLNFLKGVAARLGSGAPRAGQDEEVQDDEEGSLQRRYTSGLPEAARGGGLTRRASGVPEAGSRSRDDMFEVAERSVARGSPARYMQQEGAEEVEEGEEGLGEEEEGYAYEEDEEEEAEGEEGWGYGGEEGLEALEEGEEEDDDDDEDEEVDTSRFSRYRAQSSLAKRLERNSSRDDLYVMPRRPSTGEEGGHGQGVPEVAHGHKGGRGHRRKVSKDDMYLTGANPWAGEEEGEEVAEAFCVAPGDSEEEEEGRGVRGHARGASGQQASMVRPGHSSSSSEDRDREQRQRRRSSEGLHVLAAPGGHRKGGSWQEMEQGGGSDPKSGRRPVRRMSVGEERGHELTADQRYAAGSYDERDWEREREREREREVGSERGQRYAEEREQGRGPELARRGSRVMRRYASSEEDGRGRGMDEYLAPPERGYRPESRGSDAYSEAYPGQEGGSGPARRRFGSSEDALGPERGEGEGRHVGDLRTRGLQRHGSEQEVGRGMPPVRDREREREWEWERDREEEVRRDGGSGRGPRDREDGGRRRSMELGGDRGAEGVPLGLPGRAPSYDAGPYSPRDRNRDNPRDSPRNSNESLPRPSSRDSLNDPFSPRQGAGMPPAAGGGAPAARRAPTRGSLTRFASEGEEALGNLAGPPQQDGAHRGYPPRDPSEAAPLGREGGSYRGDSAAVNRKGLKQFRSMEEREQPGSGGARGRDPRAPVPYSSLDERPSSGAVGGWQREERLREARQGGRGPWDDRPSSAAGWEKERSVAYPDDRLSLPHDGQGGGQARGGYASGAPPPNEPLHREGSMDPSANAAADALGVDLPKLGLPSTPGPLLAAALKERAQALASGEAPKGPPKKLVRSMSDDSRAEIQALQRFHESLKGPSNADAKAGAGGKKGRAPSPEQQRRGANPGGPKAKASVVRAQADVAKEFQRLGVGGGTGGGPKGAAGGVAKKAGAFPGSQSTAPPGAGKPKPKGFGAAVTKVSAVAALNTSGRGFPGSASVATKPKGAAFPGSPSVAGQVKKAFPGSTSVAAPKGAAFPGSVSVAPKGAGNGKAFPGSTSVAGQPKKAFPGSSSVAGPGNKKPVGDGPLARMAKGSAFPASSSTAPPSGAPRAFPGSKSTAAQKTAAVQLPGRNAKTGPLKPKQPK